MTSPPPPGMRLGVQRTYRVTVTDWEAVLAHHQALYGPPAGPADRLVLELVEDAARAHPGAEHTAPLVPGLTLTEDTDSTDGPTTALVWDATEG